MIRSLEIRIAMPNVVVIGAGNAGLCAALAAAENGARVTVLERAPREERGGNSAFTAGAMRVTYDGPPDLRRLMPDLTEAEWQTNDFGTYPADAFYDDMARVTESRCDPDLTEALVSRSLGTLEWMRTKAVRFVPTYHRQAFKVNGRFRFWGGLTIEAVGGGLGLVDTLSASAERAGVTLRYKARATALSQLNGHISGVRIRTPDGGTEVIPADAVVLASGGFQANAEWRTRYLGPGWDLAKVRGTRYNTGDGIRMALDIGARSTGNWSGCHAVGWDRNAPEFGDRKVGDGFQKHSYPFGIMVNAHGKRFVDEGADFRNLTYARYGREVLAQPRQFAWQIFDSKVRSLLRDEYRIKQVTKVTADTLDELARKLDGVDPDAFLDTVKRYNEGVRISIPFNPNVKDGRNTDGITPSKSNWANRIDTPPFEGYMITCGITFTFGGVAIDARSGNVLDDEGHPIPGLFACGELVGGLFYFNYPGGAGLTAGAVFGRLAGAEAARYEA
jgi:tricarballylate dehydrogenase